MKKRVCVVILAAIVLVTTLFSCGKGSGDNDLNSENGTDAPLSDRIPITLVIIDLYTFYEVN